MNDPIHDDAEVPVPENCPTCGEPIPPSAPAGLCPKCALAGVADDNAAANTATLPFGKFVAPLIAEIAAAFPQLEILELIGCGGMAAVYKARQPHLERVIALKILPKSLAATPEFTERFTREARMLARLAHPNIVGIFDFGESGGYFYLLMEYVDGVNLRQAMRAGRFTPGQALEVVPEICNALQFAHDEGVLHRDIKPENILLDTKGRIKIADFGIAKLLGDTARGVTLTQGMAPGTPQYMAPEQIEQPGTVDHRADIYSLGVVIYEMLTGELPIGRFAAPSERTGVGVDIDEIVFRALEKQRERRQQSASEVRTDLAGVAAPLTDVTPPPRPATDAGAAISQPKVDARNRPLLALSLTICGAVLPILLLIFGVLAANGARLAEAQQKTSMAKLEARMLGAWAHAKSDHRTLRSTLGEDHPAFLKSADEIATLERQSQALGAKGRATKTRDTVTVMVLSFAVLVFVLICTVPATCFAWKQLSRQRALGQTEGRGSLLTAAWFWPMALILIAVVGFFVLALQGAPAWIVNFGSALSLPVVAAIGVLLIRRTRRWLSQTGTDTERRAILDTESRLPSVAPFKDRQLARLVAVGGGVIIACLLLSYGFAQHPVQKPLIVFVGVVGAVLVGLYFFLINRTYHLGSTATATPGYNPWPKRVFWLVLAIFLAPAAMIGVGLLMPLLAHAPASQYDGNYAISVTRSVPNDTQPTVHLQIRRNDGGILRTKVVFEGPADHGTAHISDHRLQLVPTAASEWILDRASGDSKEITFLLPDGKLGDEAYLQMNLLAGTSVNNAPLYSNLERLPLFEISRDGQTYKAWVELEWVAIP